MYHVCGLKALEDLFGDNTQKHGLAHRANSFSASVAAGAFHFWTSNTFRGGDGHRRDNRSFCGVSESVNRIDLS